MICLPCVSIPNLLHKRMLFSSFAKIAGAQKNNNKTKQKQIQICKVRLPVLLKPASCFSHRSAVRFSPENL